MAGSLVKRKGATSLEAAIECRSNFSGGGRIRLQGRTVRNLNILLKPLKNKDLLFSHVPADVTLPNSPDKDDHVLVSVPNGFNTRKSTRYLIEIPR